MIVFAEMLSKKITFLKKLQNIEMVCIRANSTWTDSVQVTELFALPTGCQISHQIEFQKYNEKNLRRLLHKFEEMLNIVTL